MEKIKDFYKLALVKIVARASANSVVNVMLTLKILAFFEILTFSVI